MTGYNSSNEARLAVQRNEIQYHDESIPGYRGAAEPQLVKTGIVTPLYYHDLISPDGTMRKSPDFPELILLPRSIRKFSASRRRESVRNAQGGQSGKWKLEPGGALAPGSPPEAVATLRQAYAALSRDEEFIAEAKKVMRFHPRFETGEDGEKLRQKVLTASPEIVDFIRKFIDQARK